MLQIRNLDVRRGGLQVVWDVSMDVQQNEIVALIRDGKRVTPVVVNVCNFSLATNRVFKDRDGKKAEQTDFHNVVVFGKQADSVST